MSVLPAGTGVIEAAEPLEASRNLQVDTYIEGWRSLRISAPQHWDQTKHLIDVQIIGKSKSHWLIATCQPTDWFSAKGLSPLDLHHIREDTDLHDIARTIVSSIIKGGHEVYLLVRQSV